MTNNKDNNKFVLKDKETGALVRMNLTGEPFIYSTKALAHQGRRSIEKDREVSLIVVPA